MPSNVIEQLYGPALRGPIRGGLTLSGHKIFGYTTQDSNGTLFQTVSTPLVSSGDLILLGKQTSVASNQSVNVSVDSIVDNVSFAIVVDKNPCAGGVQENWLLIKMS